MPVMDRCRTAVAGFPAGDAGIQRRRPYYSIRRHIRPAAHEIRCRSASSARRSVSSASKSIAPAARSRSSAARLRTSGHWALEYGRVKAAYRERCRSRRNSESFRRLEFAIGPFSGYKCASASSAGSSAPRACRLAGCHANMNLLVDRAGDLLRARSPDALCRPAAIPISRVCLRKQS